MEKEKAERVLEGDQKEGKSQANPLRLQGQGNGLVAELSEAWRPLGAAGVARDSGSVSVAEEGWWIEEAMKEMCANFDGDLLGAET